MFSSKPPFLSLSTSFFLLLFLPWNVKYLPSKSQTTLYLYINYFFTGRDNPSGRTHMWVCNSNMGPLDAGRKRKAKKGAHRLPFEAAALSLGRMRRLLACFGGAQFGRWLDACGVADRGEWAYGVPRHAPLMHTKTCGTDYVVTCMASFGV